MPDKRKHLQLGLMLGMPTVLLLSLVCFDSYYKMIIKFLCASMFLLFSTVLPDILEPATSPFHRGKFHSLNALTVSAILFLVSVLLIFIIEESYFLHGLSGLSLGYLIHLFLDSKTMMGLPKKNGSQGG